MERKKRQTGAAGSAIFLTGTAAAAQILGFVYRVILARLAGAEVMGLYQLAMSAYSVMMSLTAVGLSSTMSNLTARYLALGNGRAVEELRRCCLGVLLLGGAAVGGAAAALSDPISVYLLGDARTQLAIVLLVPCVLFTGVENIHKYIFYGAGAVRPPAFAELAEQLVRTAAVLGLLLAFLPQNPERTVGLIALGMTMCELCSSVTLILLYRAYFNKERQRGRGCSRESLLRQLAGIAVPIGFTAVLGNLMGAADAALIPRKLVERGMERPEAMAQLGVMCGMTLPMLALPTVFLGAVNLVMVPRMSRAAALGQRDRLERQISGALLTVSTLLMPAMSMMVVLGPDLGLALFGQERAGDHLLPLAAAMALGGCQGVLGGALNAMGKQKEGAAVALFCDLVQLSFTFSIPRLGIGGYAAGAVCSSALGLILSVHCVRRGNGLRLPLFRCLMAPGLGAVLMGLESHLLYRFLKEAGLSAPGAAGAVLFFGLVLYLAALQAQGVSVRENLRLE